MSEFSELHDELRSVATDLLAKDTVDWPLLVSAGWVGLDASEHGGGAGATFAEVAVICEELGRAAAVTGYLGAAVLAVGALNAVQPNESGDALLRAVVAGNTRAVLALPGPANPHRSIWPPPGWAGASTAGHLSSPTRPVPSGCFCPPGTPTEWRCSSTWPPMHPG
ncbi:acyl-CoA dehydrogenase [Mycolicibacterium fortuitum]|uniref:Acyl-CoA dehydrogenase n=1 Tax=Mycolicibacterium fortuitum TaxID=1766 RepID=A0A378V2Z4_MYCFO|nr:acyl-CoA dehydrogenase [Mycolicibacterium fortuitum]